MLTQRTIQMNLKNKIKQSIKKYKFIVLIVVFAFLSLLFYFSRGLKNKDLYKKFYKRFEKSVEDYAKNRNLFDDKAFEELERLNKRKDEIKKEINKKYKNDKIKIEATEKKQIEDELKGLEGNEKALEDWYNHYLNSFNSNSDNK